MRNELDSVLGRAFALSGAENQATVLNAAGLMAERTYGEDRQEARKNIEMQACMIAEHLNREGWAFILTIAKFASAGDVETYGR